MAGIARALADFSVKATSVAGLAACSPGMTKSVCACLGVTYLLEPRA